MSTKLLLIAGNYFPELTGIGRYNNEMVDWLADNGFDCTVISTYPYYPQWKVQQPYRKKNRWFTKEIKLTPRNNKITVYRCPHIVPSNPTGKKRMLLDFSFFISVTLKLVTLTGKKFDYVMSITPPLPLGVIAALYKKISGARFLYHVQDLQVDAARDLNMISSKKLITVLFRIERYILRHADYISTISKGMQKRLSTKTEKSVLLFPNWTDTKKIFPFNEKVHLKQLFNLNPDVPVVLYSGSIGEKQGLENLLDVVQSFQNSMPDVQFVICSSGPYQSVLINKSAELELKNITFIPLQPEEKLNALLNIADAHLVIQKADASDLVMPSKLNSILAAGGLAIVTANPGSALYDLIHSNDIGLVCSAEGKKPLADCIQYVLTNDLDNIRVNARRYAEEFLSIDKVMRQYVKDVTGCPPQFPA